MYQAILYIVVAYILLSKLNYGYHNQAGFKKIGLGSFKYTWVKIEDSFSQVKRMWIYSTLRIESLMNLDPEYIGIHHYKMITSRN